MDNREFSSTFGFFSWENHSWIWDFAIGIDGILPGNMMIAHELFGGTFLDKPSQTKKVMDTPA